MKKPLDATKVAEALGLGIFTVYAIKRASALRGEPVFFGRYTYPERVTDWLERNPSFRAYKVPRSDRVHRTGEVLGGEPLVDAVNQH